MSPRLRFPEFNDEWTMMEAETLFDNIVVKNCPHETVLTIIQGKGTVPRNEAGRNIHYDEQYLSNYKFVNKDDYIIHLRSFEGGFELANSCGIVSPAYTILRCKKPFAPIFYDAYFHTNEFINHVLYKAVEGIRDGRQISYEAFKWLKIPYCSKTEQDKIAGLLQVINMRIAKQQEIIECFKSYKRGLLSLVFNDKSPTHILGDILKKGKAGGTPQSSNSSYYNGDIPFLSIADMTEQGKYIYCTEKHISEAGLQNSTAWIVPADSLILSMYASYGLVSINKVPLATSQAMFNMIFQQDINVEYIYYFLTYLATTDYYTKMVSTGTQPNLNAEKVRSIPLFIPSQNEQKHIVKLLQTYDNRLTTEEKILTQLQMSKAALLQQLFI